MPSTFHGGIAFRLPVSERGQTAVPDLTAAKLIYRVDACTLESGTHLNGGDLLGRLNGIPVRSALSGRLTDICGDETGVVLSVEADGENSLAKSFPFGKQKGKTLAEADTDELLDAVEESGIVEQSGEPLIAHLRRALSKASGKLRMAAVSCIDLDPLCQTNISITEEKADAVAGGLTILLRLLRLKEGAMICDSRYKHSVKAAQKACKASTLIAIELTKNRYPQASPRLLTRWLTDREISDRKTPEDAGLFLTDAETCASLYRCFAEGLPSLWKRVSVFSDGRLRVCDLPYGLPIEALEESGVLRAAQGESLCRGLMDGRELPQCVDAGLNVLAFLPNGGVDAASILPNDGEEGHTSVNDSPEASSKSSQTAKPARTEREMLCIRCGKCAEVCPMYLSPYDYLPKNRLQKWLSGTPRDASACIGCGCCSYSCPAGLPLRGMVEAFARKEHQNDR